jgi:hypothetical protein
MECSDSQEHVSMIEASAHYKSNIGRIEGSEMWGGESLCISLE